MKTISTRSAAVLVSRTSSSLIALALALAACGRGQPGQPSLFFGARARSTALLAPLARPSSSGNGLATKIVCQGLSAGVCTGNNAGAVNTIATAITALNAPVEPNAPQTAPTVFSWVDGNALDWTDGTAGTAGLFAVNQDASAPFGAAVKQVPMLFSGYLAIPASASATIKTFAVGSQDGFKLAISGCPASSASCTSSSVQAMTYAQDGTRAFAYGGTPSDGSGLPVLQVKFPASATDQLYPLQVLTYASASGEGFELAWADGAQTAVPASGALGSYALVPATSLYAPNVRAAMWAVDPSSPIANGNKITITVSIQNLGPVSSGPLTLSFNTSFLTAPTIPTGCSSSSGGNGLKIVTCSNLAALAAGGSVQLQFGGNLNGNGGLPVDFQAVVTGAATAPEIASAVGVAAGSDFWVLTDDLNATAATFLSSDTGNTPLGFAPNYGLIDDDPTRLTPGAVPPQPPGISTLTSPQASDHPIIVSGTSKFAQGSGISVVATKGSQSVGCTATAAADGSWSCGLKLGVGSWSLVAEETDPSGLAGQPSTAVSLTVTAPGAPTLSLPLANALVRTSSVAFSGTTTEPAGTQVQVQATGPSSPTCLATADASGNWSCSISLANASWSWTAAVVDVTGAPGTAAAARALTVNTVFNPPTIAQTASPTANATPALSGTAPSGESGAGWSVTVYEGSTAVPGCTSVAVASAAWSCTVSSALADGSHSLVAELTDPSGNQSPPSNPDVVTVDTSVPPSPGFAAVPSPTSNARPVFNGTGVYPFTVSVLNGAAVVCSTTVTSAGLWSCQPSAALADGAYTLAARQINLVGTQSPVASRAFTVDTHVPATPSIAQPASPTNVAAPALSGTGEASDALAVTDQNGATVCTATVGAGGTWSCVSATLANGTSTLTARSVSPAGIASLPSAPVSLVVDTVAPPPPTLAQTASPTGNTAPAFSGTAEAGSLVKVWSGSTLLCTATASSGSFSCTTGVALTGTPQTYSVTATATDAAGNVSSASAADVFTVDTRAPAPATLDPLPAPSGGVSGNTSNSLPTFTGTGTPGDTVTVSETAPGSQVLCSAVVSSAGTWSCQTTVPLPGPTTYTVAAAQTSPAGVTSTQPAAQSFTVDAHVPATPTLSAVASPTNQNAPALAGTGEAGSVVTVRDQTGRVLCTATVNGSGAWSCTSLALPDGSTTLSATATTASGVPSAGSAAQTVVIDTQKPAPPVLQQNATPTVNTTPTFNGTAEPGSAVVVSDGSVQLCSAAAGTSGAFTCQSMVALGAGSHPIVAVAADAAGNASAPSAADQIDVVTSAPAAPTLDPLPAPAGGVAGYVSSVQPTFTGQGIAGDLLTVQTSSGTALCHTTVAADGTWSCVSAVALTGTPATSYTVLAIQQDLTGPASASSPTQAFVVDAHVPTTPAIAPLASPTNDPRPAVSGTGEAGTTVAVLDETGRTVCSATVSAASTWSCTSLSLPDGTSTLVAVATTAAGVSSQPSAGQTLLVDTLPPAAPSLSPTASPTAQTQPTFQGTAEPGSRVAVSAQGAILCTATADASGAFSCRSSAVLSGAPQSYSATAAATDAAGNTSAASAPDNFVVDTTQPGAPTIDALPVAPGGQPGNTAQLQPTFSGTGTPGDLLTVSLSGGGTLCSALVGADGRWACNCAAPLGAGPQTVVATQQNGAGASSPQSATLAFTVDAHTPAAPSLAAPPSPTHDATPVLSGTAEAGASVQVRDQTGRVLCGVSPVPASGAFSCTSASLPDGVTTLSAVAISASGQASAASSTQSISVDTQIPSRPGLDQTPSPTSDVQPVFSGRAEPGTQVAVLEGSTVLCSVQADASGAFACAPAVALTGAPQTHTVVAQATDAAGNTSAPSAGDVFVLDTTQPGAPAIDALAASPGGQPGTTASAQPTFSGTGVPGDTLHLSLSGGGQLCAALVGADGRWSCNSTVALTDGAYAAVAVQMSPAGVASPASAPLSFAVDSHVPAAPVLAAVASPTNHPALPLSGTAEASARVSVADQTGRVLCAAVASSGGAWSCLGLSLPDGSFTLTAVATSAAGVASGPSNAVAVTVDTLAPLAPRLDATPSPSGNTAPTFTGAAEPGSLVQVSEGATALCSATAQPSGAFACQTQVALTGAPQTHSVVATATDAAGNVGPASAADAFVVDTSLPAPPTLDAVQGAGALSGSTASAQPTFGGTGAPGATVTVSLSTGVSLCSALVASTGRWACNSAVALGDGSYSAAATQVSGTGVVSAPSAPVAFVVDSSVPASPTLSQLASPTNQPQPLLSGTGAPGARITAADQTGRVLCSATVAQDGTWSCTSAQLPDGSDTVVASELSASGVAAAATASRTVLVDTQPPAAPSLAQTPSPTGMTTPTFTGTAEPAATVTVWNGAQALCSGPAAGGVFSCQSTVALTGSPQSYSVTATAKDAAGNVGAASAPDAFVVDTRVPQAPTLDALPTPALGQAGNTASTRPTFSGTGLPGDVVAVAESAPGTQTLCTAPVASDGSWTCTCGATLIGAPATAYVVAATQSGVTGIGSAASAAIAFTVDTHVPATPTLQAGPTPTNVNTPALSGTAEAGARVIARDQTGRTLCSALADAAGNWSCTSAALPDGTAILAATATSPAGVASASSSPASLLIDTLAPAAPALAPMASPTRETQPTFTGSAEPGSAVAVSEGATLLCSAQAGPTGSFSCRSQVALSGAPAQSHAASAVATDAAGNASPASAAVAFVVDTTQPGAPTLSLVATPAAAQPGFCGNANPTFAGSGTAGDRVAVATAGGTALCSATVAFDGSWTCGSTVALPGVPATAYTVVATQISPDGVTSMQSGDLTFTVDTHVPAAPALAALVSPTNDRTPTLSGTAEAGDPVSVRDGNGTLICTAVAAANGAWSCVAGGLPDGAMTLTAFASSPGGLGPSGSAPIALVVDTQPPAAPVLAQTPSPFNLPQPTFSGTAEPRSSIAVSDGATLLCSTTADASGSFSCASTLALAAAPVQHGVTAKATDAAGNVSLPSAVDSFVIDLRTLGSTTLDAVGPVLSVVQPTFGGTGTAGDAIAVAETLPAAQVLCNATVAPDGRWSCQSAATLSGIPATQYAATATETTPAGQSATTAPRTFTVDSHQPLPPALAPLASPTASHLPLLSGTAEAGAFVEIVDGYGALVATATADATLAFSAAPSAPLPDGDYRFSARQTATNGLHSAFGAAVSLSIRSLTAPTLDAPRTPTADVRPVLSGGGQAGMLVSALAAEAQVCSAIVAPGGTWSCQPSGALADGTYLVQAVASDPAGHTSAVSNSRWLVVDTTAPAAPALDALPSPAAAARPVLSGTAEAGSAVAVRDQNGTLVCTAVASAAGSFSCAATAPLAAGSYGFTATAADAAGNVSRPSATVPFVEAAPPAMPLILSPADGAKLDAAPALVSGSTAANTQVRVTVDGAPYDAQLGAAGRWSVAPGAALSAGSHTVVAIAVDALGVSSASATSTFTVAEGVHAQGGCSTSGGPGWLLAVSALLAWAGTRRRRARAALGARVSLPLGAAALVAAVLLPAAARAQVPSVDVSLFRPASGSDGFAGVEGARPPSSKTLELKIWGDAAFQPLVVTTDAGGRQVLIRDRVGAWLTGQAHVSGPLSLAIQVPMTVQQRGDLSALPPSQQGAASFGAGLSDIRLTPRVALLDQATHGFDLAAQASLDLPTAASDSLSGDGRLGGGVLVAAGHRFAVGGQGSVVELVGNASAELRPPRQITDVKLGNELGAGLAAALEPAWSVPARFFAEAQARGSLRAGFSSASSPAEWRLGGEVCLGRGVSAELAGGSALTQGIGAPRARVLMAFGWSGAGCARGSVPEPMLAAAPPPPPPPAPVCPAPLAAVPLPPPPPPPPPPAPAKVAPTPAWLQLSGKVYFEKNRAVLQKRSFKALNDIALKLLRHPEALHVRIEGHTDDSGSPARNLSLSQTRAQAVVDYLVRRGIERQRLTAQGFGQEQPIADNSTAAGRELNRRVELRLAEPVQMTEPALPAAPASAPAPVAAPAPAAAAPAPVAPPAPHG